MSVPLAQPAPRWFVCPEPRLAAAARVFCLPHAGGSTALYRPWLSHLPARLELNVVHLPGRDSRLREPPYTRMEPLLTDLIPALARRLDRPYALFGHSMGALVAFETARALRRQGIPAPACLIVSGRRAPQLPDVDAPLHGLAEEAFVTAMARRYHGIPAAILADEELKRLFLPIVRADLAVIETYRYREEPPLDCPIVALGGQDDLRASHDELLAWQAQTTAGCHVVQWPGDHFYLQRAGAAVVATITSALAPSMAGCKGAR